MLRLTRAPRGLQALGLCVLAFVVAAALLPAGLPFGVVLLGLVLGGLSSLTAMGLVIVYRSARVINFAQAEIGALSASVAVVLVTGMHLPYFAGVPLGLAAALVTGALVDATVVRRLFQAPRLILTVATIGLAQVLGAAEIVLPTEFSHLRAFSTFTTPFRSTFSVGPIVFNGNHVAALVAIPAVLVGLATFFSRTDAGIAIRGAADSNERALLLGIPVRRLSRLTWVIAAGLSGLGAILSTPILGANIGGFAGPQTLLAPLAAAVIAGMESLPIALAASLGIGVFQQAVFWSYPRSATVDVALFVLVMGALVLQRRRHTRVDDGDLGGFVAVREARPIAAALRRLPEVRAARAAIWILVTVVLAGAPLVLSDSKLTLLAYMAIYGVIAASLVILTGWSGQISLGQFAFAGVGAATTASLMVHVHADLFAALFVAATAGAVAAVLIGIPAVRITGPFLAVATLAFAVPASTYLLNPTYFRSFNPALLPRPVILDRFRLDSATAFYSFCVLMLAASVLVATNYRRTRAGRAAIAVRDNRRGAAAFSISPTRAKLAAFALAGALAGLAGGLYAIGLRGVGFGAFNPEGSLQVFTMVVIGGLGSLSGALVGAIYVQGAQYFLHGAAQLLATGAGILLVVQFAPGGLADYLYRLRDWALQRLAHAKRLDEPPPPTSDEASGSIVVESEPELARLAVEGVDAGYGRVQVLFGVDFRVPDGDVLALLGTNGAGKSTLLRVIAGLLPATSGRITFDGSDITAATPIERVQAGIVTVPGGRGVFPSLTVQENLRLAGWIRRRDRAFIGETTRRVLELFPALGTRLEVKAGSLSGGEQQMLTIAQGLLCDPKLLLIDELSLGLAPTVVSELLDTVRALIASGITIVMVEQSLNVAASIAERSVFMERGQVRFTGETAHLADRPDLARAVFFGAARPRSRAKPSPAVTSPTGAAFEVVEVRRSFGGVRALDGVSLTAAPGSVLGIIGANGAGKTTLFDICSGFLAADGGRVLFAGEDVTHLGAPGRAARGLGRVFQDARLFPSMTVSEAVAVALERHIDVRDPFLCLLRSGPVIDSERAVARQASELLEEFGLDRWRDTFISELSTGTRRALELACAVAHRPSVLLLDEPSSGVAQRETEALAELLVRLKEQTGSTFVIIEHDVPLVASLSDTLVCLHLGAVLSAGRPKDVLDDPAVIAAYLGSDEAAIVRSGRRARTRRRRAATGV